MWLILFRNVIYFGPLNQKYPDLRKNTKRSQAGDAGFFRQSNNNDVNSPVCKLRFFCDFQRLLLHGIGPVRNTNVNLFVKQCYVIKP